MRNISIPPTFQFDPLSLGVPRGEGLTKPKKI